MDKSDTSATLADLKKHVQQFCEERGWDGYHTPKDLAIGLSTEANELLEVFRFVSDAEQMHQMNKRRQDVADELADSLFFILRFAQMYGFDLSEGLTQKMVKSALKYPVGSNDYAPRATALTLSESEPSKTD